MHSLNIKWGLFTNQLKRNYMKLALVLTRKVSFFWIMIIIVLTGLAQVFEVRDERGYQDILRVEMFQFFLVFLYFSSKVGLYLIKTFKINRV